MTEHFDERPFEGNRPRRDAPALATVRFLATFVGIVCIAVVAYAMRLYLVSGTDLIISLAVVALLGGVLIDRAFVRHVWWRLSRIRPWVCATWVILAMLGGAALLLWWSPTVPRPTPVPVELTVVATPHKNPEAKGNEVWVDGLWRGRDKRIDAAEFELEGDWEIRRGVPVSYQRKPATLRWRGLTRGDMTLRLARGEWCGMADITWNGETHRVDLYPAPTTSPAVNDDVEDDSGPLRVPLLLSRAQRQPPTLYRLMVYSAWFMLFSLAALFISVWGWYRVYDPAAFDPGRWSWVRLVVTIGIVVLAMDLAPAAGPFGWGTYFRRARSLGVTLTEQLEEFRAYRAFFQEHIPPGELVLTDETTGRWLIAFHDVYVMATSQGGGAAVLEPGRLETYAALRAIDTPWNIRRRLLDAYDITWVLYGTWRADEFAWAREHARRRLECQGYVLIELDRTTGPSTSAPRPN